MNDTAAMGKARHTPGPWTANGWTVRAAGMIVASIRHHGQPLVTSANAQLIALAPEMYELLSEAAVDLANLDSPDNPVVKRIRDVMRSVGQ